MARPSRWGGGGRGKADGAVERWASPWHDIGLRTVLGSTVTVAIEDVAAWLRQLLAAVFNG
jgi:hypothetical protein